MLQPQSKPQPIHLIIYSSPLFPAHRSLFLPHPNASSTGKRIHATGDAATGFSVEFDRTYDFSAESRSYKVLELGDVLGDGGVYFGLGEGEGEDGFKQKEVNGIKVYDRLEEIATRVEAPGKSLRSVGGSGEEGPRRRVEVKNCQTWLPDVLAELVKHGVLRPEAPEIIKNAPKH